MKLNTSVFAFALLATIVLAPAVTAQTNVPVVAAGVVHTNTAIIPVPRTGSITNRQSLVLQRARENPGDCDIEFIGDSITQGWETRGSNVWAQYYGRRKVINMGVSGDRTQHVLWRFEQGQLDGVKAKAAVVMIGTNNLVRTVHAPANTAAEIDDAVGAVLARLKAQSPQSGIILMAIFPRGPSFSPQRGKILQVNEALAKLDDGKNIFYIDIGPQLIESNGSISKNMMRDYLHPGEAGYKIWASAIEPKLKEILAD